MASFVSFASVIGGFFLNLDFRLDTGIHPHRNHRQINAMFLKGVYFVSFSEPEF